MKFLRMMLLIVFIIYPLTLWSNTTVSKVEKNLMCTCGCTMPLYTCECDTAGEMRSQIKGMIEQGKDTDQIVSTFVARYGEKILSAPTKRGFNLLAWIMPFFALLLVSVFLYKALRRWSGESAEPRSNFHQKLQEQYGDKLQEELDKFEEGETA